MKRTSILVGLILIFLLVIQITSASESFRVHNNIIEKNDQGFPIGEPGLRLTYNHISKEKLPGSVVRTIHLIFGAIKHIDGIRYQWLQLQATKENKKTFNCWLLSSGYPERSRETAQATIQRYIFQVDNAKPLEFIHHQIGSVVLPSTGAWEFLLPRAASVSFTSSASSIRYLGHKYRLEKREQSIAMTVPMQSHVIRLSPDLLIGVPHNTRQKDETRRYDESDYELIRLTPEDYQEMIAAGLNCFRVDAEQVRWIDHADVYYWGIGGKDVSYPECLYKSNYIGPALFFDEPMVRTRDHVIRPKLKKDPALGKTLTPQKVLEDFKKLYHETKYEHSATALLKGLAAREDVDIGDMNFLQQNMYTWETMVSSALYQLSEGDGGPPYAMVFEPPGRFGTRRVLPELNMCFDCQIPADDPKNLAGIIFGFLRGAARMTGKAWGTSIYGAVDRSDTFWFLTHAYDLGASLFFYWDSYQLACVPYNEYLSMTRHLRAHAGNSPKRNLERLKKAAEVAIVLPAGYNLGHVYMGRGVFWGTPELNLERINSKGVTYRQVMSQFYTEIERYLRLGISFDLFWDLEDLTMNGYREVVTIREDGKVGLLKNGKHELMESARKPFRPDGNPPRLTVEISKTDKTGLYEITAHATVVEGSAPIFYTQGTDKNGISNNQYVLWELFGPAEEDYHYLRLETWAAKVVEKDAQAEIEVKFEINKPGNYRLRAATVDIAGRSTVVWKDLYIND